MRLTVNGQMRQDGYCEQMIHAPAATLTELSALQDVHAGDLIATGTPAGCAARAPSRPIQWIARHFLSDAQKWKTFIAKGKRNPAYLHPGDRMQASIRTDDGLLDLGVQTTAITGE
jgi:2-keto-4-pentenoate hydratase/2-oxohepta-3-ene-1,7-dioic acid hydratase in catechol pathway